MQEKSIHEFVGHIDAFGTETALCMKSRLADSLKDHDLKDAL